MGLNKHQIDSACNHANILYKKVLNDYNLQIIDFSFNKLGTKSKAGHFAHIKEKSIEIKINILVIILFNKVNYLNKISETVLHEIAHYIQFEYFDYSNHDHIFYEILGELEQKYLIKSHL
jgi:predicted SprT family Zn-dependent metalloprotease